MEKDEKLGLIFLSILGIIGLAIWLFPQISGIIGLVQFGIAGVCIIPFLWVKGKKK